MTQTMTNPAWASLPLQVQQILPILGSLSFEERFSIIDYLYHVDKQSTEQTSKKLSPLDRQYLAGVVVSDDFDDELDDDFWLGGDK
ncbi:MAG: hypothetical protein Q4G13_09260 [Moraxella sp.]|nr:hypothetical protein [Moraxella sp.]